MNTLDSILSVIIECGIPDNKEQSKNEWGRRMGNKTQTSRNLPPVIGLLLFLLVTMDSQKLGFSFSSAFPSSFSFQISYSWLMTSELFLTLEVFNPQLRNSDALLNCLTKMYKKLAEFNPLGLKIAQVRTGCINLI